jgi:GntR family transcriptional regulator/MocR family aminotransferase
MVLPQALAPMFAAAKRLSDRHATTGLQRALARLLADGSYDRHVRRIRRLQHARQAALVTALSRHLGGRVEVRGAASGLHVVAWFPELAADDEPALAQAARSRGVHVYPIGPFFLPGAEVPPRPAGLVMGYALLEAGQIDAGVAALKVALDGVIGSR